MLGDILMNYTIIQEIWQHHWESLTMSKILRKEGIENSGSEEPLQSILLPCSSDKAMRKRLNDKKVLRQWLTMPWVFGLVLKWHDNSELSPLGDASVIPWPEQNFSAGSWIAEQKFAPRLVIKGKRAKNSYTERKTEECFQWKTIGSCSRGDPCSFLHTHATGDREDNVEWSGNTQEILI